jgi:uncharacterized protein YuzE
MRLHYYSETDSLYLELNERPGVDALEISEGLVLDVDVDRSPVGIDIDRASQRLDLTTSATVALPVSTRANASGS